MNYMETPITDDQAVRVLCSIAFILILAVNIWYWGGRAAMTPEERKAEDDELRSDPHSWWP
jgi:hypothetical protein